jgi:hypothetical protein
VVAWRGGDTEEALAALEWGTPVVDIGAHGAYRWSGTMFG